MQPRPVYALCTVSYYPVGKTKPDRIAQKEERNTRLGTHSALPKGPTKGLPNTLKSERERERGKTLLSFSCLNFFFFFLLQQKLEEREKELAFLVSARISSSPNKAT